jgi:hypothetical protein
MPQLIDPIIPATPVRKRRPVKLRSPARARLATPQTRRTQRHRIAPPRQPQPKPAPQPVILQPAPQPDRPFAEPTKKQSWLARHPRLHRILHLFLLPGVIIGGAIVGIVIQSAAVGQAVLALYAIIALIFRIESKQTFAIALLMLCALIAMLLFYTSNTLATNFAIYTFILLIIGVISLLREVRERYA